MTEHECLTRIHQLECRIAELKSDIVYIVVCQAPECYDIVDVYTDQRKAIIRSQCDPNFIVISKHISHNLV